MSERVLRSSRSRLAHLAKVAAVVLTTSATLAACTSSSPSAASKAPSSSSSPAASSKAPALTSATIVMPVMPAGGGNPFAGGYAGQAVQVMPAIFDALTQGTSKGIEPQLATSWKEISPTEWQFDLRQGVTFSNGEPFNAAAAAFSINYAASPAGQKTPVGDAVPQLVGATVVSNYVIDVTTKTPVPILPGLLDQLNIVAPKYWQQVGPSGYSTQPVGTGPYEVTNWGPTSITLKRFAGAWQPGKFQTLTFEAVPNATSRYEALQSGQAQLDYTPSMSQIKTAKSSSNINVISAMTPNGMTLQYLDSPGSPIENEAVRVAMNEAIDRAAIQSQIFNGLGIIASQGVGPGATGHDASLGPIPYDPTTAKALLAKAGYPNGFSVTIDDQTTGITGEPEVLQIIQSELAAVGIKVTYDALPFPTWLADFLGGKFPGAQMTTVLYGATPQMDGALALDRGSCLEVPAVVWCQHGNGQNKLLTQITSETNPTTRAHLLDQVATLQRANPPALWAFGEVNWLLASKNVSARLEVINTIDFATLGPAS